MSELIAAHVIGEEAPEPESTFEGWPLHVTLVSWFEAPDEETLLASLNTIAETTSDFDGYVGGLDYFGPNKDIPVHLVEPSEYFRHLHKRLFGAITEVGATLTSPNAYIGDDYKPHVSHQDGQSLTEDDPLYVSHFSLFTRISDRPHLKRTVASFKLMDT